MLSQTSLINPPMPSTYSIIKYLRQVTYKEKGFFCTHLGNSSTTSRTYFLAFSKDNPWWLELQHTQTFTLGIRKQKGKCQVSHNLPWGDTPITRSISKFLPPSNSAGLASSLSTWPFCLNYSPTPLMTSFGPKYLPKAPPPKTIHL